MTQIQMNTPLLIYEQVKFQGSKEQQYLDFLTHTHTYTHTHTHRKKKKRGGGKKRNTTEPTDKQNKQQQTNKQKNTYRRKLPRSFSCQDSQT